jgi:hypothetical protein
MPYLAWKKNTSIITVPLNEVTVGSLFCPHLYENEENDRNIQMLLINWRLVTAQLLSGAPIHNYTHNCLQLATCQLIAISHLSTNCNYYLANILRYYADTSY